MDEWDAEPRVAFRHHTRGCGIYLRSPFFVCVFIESDWRFSGTFAHFSLSCALPADLLAGEMRPTIAPKSVRNLLTPGNKHADQCPTPPLCIFPCFVFRINAKVNLPSTLHIMQHEHIPITLVGVHVCFVPGKKTEEKKKQQRTVTVVLQPIFKICQFVANERHAIATNGVKVGRWGGIGRKHLVRRQPHCFAEKGGVRKPAMGWQVFLQIGVFFSRFFFFFLSPRVPQTQCQSISRQHPLRLLPLGMR